MGGATDALTVTAQGAHLHNLDLAKVRLEGEFSLHGVSDANLQFNIDNNLWAGICSIPISLT